VFLALAVVATADAAQGAGSRWRTSRYGRRGAEIWAEAPRFVAPTGKGYDDEYDLREGWGFGFGIMFAGSDNLGFEGRMLQTTHEALSSGRTWHIDQYFVGGRYMFRQERRVQPYLSAGGIYVGLEWQGGSDPATDFERLSGYGAYATAGVDYIISSRWVAGLRTDFLWMKYTRSIVGTDESALDDPRDGGSVGLSFTVGYRVPVWW